MGNVFDCGVSSKYSKYFKCGNIVYGQRDQKCCIMSGLVLREDVREKLLEYRKQHSIEESVEAFPHLSFTHPVYRNGMYCAGWGMTFESTGEGFDDRGNLVVCFGAESNLVDWCERIEIGEVQVSERELYQMSDEEKFNLAKKYGAIDKYLEKLDGMYDDAEKLMSV